MSARFYSIPDSDSSYIARAHYNVAGIGDPPVRKANGYAGEVNSDGARFLPTQLRLRSRLSPLSILHESVEKHGVGVLSDAALFVARLRSNPKFHYQPLTILINVVRILIHQQCVP